MFGFKETHLLSDEIEEGLVALDLKQGLCLLQTHPCAETAIELEHNRLAEELECKNNVG
jgi:hypothetical protein